jgi:uncharacterized membrane protein
MTVLISWIRRWYGAHPLHLLALLAAFALAGYAVRAVVTAGQWRGFAVWFVVAIVGHDLLLFPLYSLADLSLRRLLPRWATRHGGADETATAGAPAVRTATDQAAAGSSAGQAAAGSSAAVLAPHASPPPFINHLRVPAGFSLLLLLVWFPLILGLSSVAYHRASDLTTAPYLSRWLAVTGLMFAASAVSYAIRLRRASAQARKARKARARQARQARPRRRGR